MLKNLIVKTPLIPFRTEDPRLAGRIFLKAENLQPFGSYKIRGVKSAIEFAGADVLKNGLVTASAGNMAQAVAFAAQLLKVPCRIYVPDSAPQVKKSAIKKIGAELIELPFAQVWNMVKLGLPEESGLMIHPTRTAGLTDGYGAIAEEILADLPNTDAIVVPFGVGGLSLGITQKAQLLNRNIKIFTAEPETAAPFSSSLQAGKPMSVTRHPSFVDAIGTPEVLPEVFSVLASQIESGLVMNLKEIKKTLALLYRDHKLVCEGAAATALAAAINLAHNSDHQKIVCLLSGGNIPPEVLNEILVEF